MVKMDEVKKCLMCRRLPVPRSMWDGSYERCGTEEGA